MGPPPPLSTPQADLSNLALIVTGATSGLGKQIALTIARANARAILVCGRNQQRGDAVVREIVHQHPNCNALFHKADVASPDDCAAMVKRAVDAFTTLDGLVNSAAICFPRGDLLSTNLELWESMVRTNLTAPFLLTQAVAAHMKERGVQGSIVNIGSCAAHGGSPIMMAYSVSKGGLSVLTKNNATELRPHRIRVNQLNMGWCFTDAEDAGQRAEKGDNWLEEADASSSMGRLLRPVDTAAAVAFLLSPASSMMTGAIIDISPEVIPGMMPQSQG